MSETSVQSALDPWLEAHLVCPVDKSALAYESGFLVSQAGRRYPVIEGVPVMLVADAEQTIGVARESLRLSAGAPDPTGLYLESLGITEAEQRGVRALAESGTAPIDPVVAYMVGATNGIAYNHLRGRLTAYPIPQIRLPAGDGRRLLDLGCNWGRWCIAAARRGYHAVGIDPSLGAVLAARRVAASLGVSARFVVADARYLPFSRDQFDVVYSYSVLQHLGEPDVNSALREAGRVLVPGGRALIQMAHNLGVRSLYHQLRRGFRRPVGFEVRYWGARQLRRAFSDAIGPTQLHVDCFFGLGLQPADLPVMRPLLRTATRLSERLRIASERMPLLLSAADSLYIESMRKS